ncbi:hypothetical protein F4779DRAFT_640554 [Xylariaceae sp. FL0662B]|nr:hypothetical protein F4779DRAFT_640554 [Xylariaceae sp. FL0662B]
MKASLSFHITLKGTMMRHKPRQAAEPKAPTRYRMQINKRTKKAPSTKLSQVEKAAAAAAARRAAAQLARERETRRRESVWDGREFLRDFLRTHFGEYLRHIQITSELTLDEIRMIGNEADKKWGTRQCRRLFNAPVLSDSIGYLLWCELRQGDALDHSHLSWVEDDEVEPEPEPERIPAEGETGERRVSEQMGTDTACFSTSDSLYEGILDWQPIVWTQNCNDRHSCRSSKATTSSGAITITNALTADREPTPESKAKVRKFSWTKGSSRKSKVGCLFDNFRRRMTN